MVEIHRYTFEQEHDFPCLVFSGSQAKKKLFYDFFSLTFLDEAVQTKEERQELD